MIVISPNEPELSGIIGNCRSYCLTENLVPINCEAYCLASIEEVRGVEDTPVERGVVADHQWRDVDTLTSSGE